MPTWSIRLTSRVLLGLFAGCLTVPVVDPVAKAAWVAPPGCASPAPAALAGFFDDAVPGWMAHGVPGAVVSVVAGGNTVFAKGYGQADAQRGVGFDASRSLVRIASITKLFTWTAVMQQVEAGRLDLNADVNRYLKTFKIPSTYPEPVTLQTLMDHTAGFEDRVIGTAARTSADVPPLGDYLAANIPARIRPPGEISAYSNYGAALAGYIVAQVSGEPYDRYVQRHLFEPMGMTHSTATEPVPGTLGTDLAHSYNSDTSPPQSIPFTFVPMTPEGAITATAADMAHFMVAHLHEGRFGNASILAPATAAQMHEPSFSADPRLDGYAHSFKEHSRNGHRILMHDGSWEGFVSVLMLVPGCDLGLFVSTNGTGGDDALRELRDTFLDRFAPAAAIPDTATPANTVPRTTPAAAQAGYYEPTRHNETTIDKLRTLLGAELLTVSSDHTVHFKHKNWAPQQDGLYRQLDGTRLTFRTGTDGRRYMVTDDPSYQLMTRTETPPFNQLVLLAFTLPALTALAVLLAGVWSWIVHRPLATSVTWRAARWLAASAAALSLTFLISLNAMLTGDTGDFLYGVPLSLRLLLGVPIVALMATTAATACTIKGWRGSGAGVVARVHQVALLAGMAALAWFLWQWNLIEGAPIGG